MSIQKNLPSFFNSKHAKSCFCNNHLVSDSGSNTDRLGLDLAMSLLPGCDKVPLPSVFPTSVHLAFSHGTLPQYGHQGIGEVRSRNTICHYSHHILRYTILTRKKYAVLLPLRVASIKGRRHTIVKVKGSPTSINVLNCSWFSTAIFLLPVGITETFLTRGMPSL